MQPSIIIADSYLESFRRLDKKSQRIVHKSLKQFKQQSKGSGFSLHRLERVKCDRSFRSARVNADLRFIIAQKGDKYFFLYVDHHDEAYRWAEGKYLDTSPFGALYVYDEKVANQKLEDSKMQSAMSLYGQGQKGLLEQKDIEAKDLEKLGIPEVHANKLITIQDEDFFINYIEIFPEELQEALMDLATGNKTITQVFAELQSNSVTEDEASLHHPDSKRRFHILDDLDELDYMVLEDMEKWTVFLHPKQEELVQGNFRGPVLVEGGPGTGKTVVGMHRTVYLASKVYTSPENRILFCTYSRKLASYVEEKIQKLFKQKKAKGNIEVKGVDQLLFGLAQKYDLGIKWLNRKAIMELLKETWLQLAPEESLEFYEAEYLEIIQKYHIRQERDYLRVNRKGRGSPLNPAVRKRIWKFFKYFLEQKERRKLYDFEDLAFAVGDALQKGLIPPLYDSIVIDEAQDLTALQIRALTKLVKNRENNLMFLSDQNQRIFRLTSWRNEVNVDIVGRTFYLDLNYRTTKQIREYADNQFINSEMEVEHIRNYKSLLSGPEPLVREFKSRGEQYKFIVTRIKGLLKEGLKPHEICIISPSDINEIKTILEYENISCTFLKRDIYPREGNGINICTLEGCKGLEFRTVFITNYTDIHRSDLTFTDRAYGIAKIKQLECLRYVAATRAREELIITFVS
ncbi:MAG: DEAD/DEAH box helicase [Thermosipho sp. (in: Bacteria)]|nr:DEAD/DEAH box helicase [Thermosipho sp. (in: thermotogales)]